MNTLNSMVYTRRALSVTGVGVLLALLLLVPLASYAAGSVTVQTDKSSYSGNTTMTVSGVVTPAPGSGTQVALSITSPSGAVIDATNAAVNGATGAYSTTFTLGGPSYTVNGTYTVTATAGNGATNSATFTYGCSGCSPSVTSTQSGSCACTATTIVTTIVTTVEVTTTVNQATTVTQAFTTTVAQTNNVITTISQGFTTTVMQADTTGTTVGAIGVVIAIVAGALAALALRKR